MRRHLVARYRHQGVDVGVSQCLRPTEQESPGHLSVIVRRVQKTMQDALDPEQMKLVRWTVVTDG